MFPEVENFLGVEDEDGVIGVFESGDENSGNFLISHFISTSLKRKSKVAFLALEQTLGHYHAIGLKSGLNLIKSQSENFVVIEALKEFDEIYASKGDFAEDVLKKTLSALDAFGKDEDKVLIVDRISLMTSYGLNLRDSIRFVRNLINEAVERDFKVTALTRLDPDNEEFNSFFAHYCDLRIQVEPLKTGRSNLVNGNVAIKRKRKKAHFKIEDKTVRIIPIGASKAVL